MIPLTRLPDLRYQNRHPGYAAVPTTFYRSPTMASGQAVATWNTYRTLDAQPTGVNVKASPGEVAGWYLSNNASAVR